VLAYYLLQHWLEHRREPASVGLGKYQPGRAACPGEESTSFEKRVLRGAPHKIFAGCRLGMRHHRLIAPRGWAPAPESVRVGGHRAAYGGGLVRDESWFARDVAMWEVGVQRAAAVHDDLTAQLLVAADGLPPVPAGPSLGDVRRHAPSDVCCSTGEARLVIDDLDAQIPGGVFRDRRRPPLDPRDPDSSWSPRGGPWLQGSHAGCWIYGQRFALSARPPSRVRWAHDSGPPSAWAWAVGPTSATPDPWEIADAVHEAVAEAVREALAMEVGRPPDPLPERRPMTPEERRSVRESLSSRFPTPALVAEIVAASRVRVTGLEADSGVGPAWWSVLLGLDGDDDWGRLRAVLLARW